jgi:hypothetical protein
MLEEFDKHVSILSESLARMLTRRKMAGTTVKGLFTTVAAATLGQLPNLGEVHASCHCTCDDCWTTGYPCDHIGYPCPPHYCPSGCVTCYIGDCGGWCTYTSGTWVSCSGLGKCGRGYRICRDCKCPHCSHKCSCLSAIVCENCCTAQDVRSEMARLAAMAPGSA